MELADNEYYTETTIGDIGICAVMQTKGLINSVTYYIDGAKRQAFRDTDYLFKDLKKCKKFFGSVHPEYLTK